MFKTLIVAATFAIALIQPVFAQESMKTDTMRKFGEMMVCNDTSVMKMQSEIDAIKMQKTEGAARNERPTMAVVGVWE